ncbi:MAG: NAD(P)-dependent oxidoreductase [Eubacterium sp.]|nr:NAD(P)-dependent oxidoreductase [Eubacterium sp.]
MKVLVTGSNGFIGGHVCKYLLNQGVYVIGLDLHDEMRKECSEYIRFNLATDDMSKILDTISVDKIDAVVHLASDMRHEPYTVDVVTNNLRGTQKLLEYCIENKMSSFVQLSSLPVIGSPKEVPIKENHSIKPPTVYHVTKYTQELLADYSNYTFGLRTASFRICAPVGTGVNPKTIFPTFVRRALAGEDITLIGKGTRRQTYIHVNDIAQALYKALCNENAQGTYNLASYNNLSNKELAEIIIKQLGSSSKIEFLDTPDPMDDYNWEVCIDKIANDIGYKPEVGIEYAIDEYARYVRESE